MPFPFSFYENEFVREKTEYFHARNKDLDFTTIAISNLEIIMKEMMIDFGKDSSQPEKYNKLWQHYVNFERELQGE
jgi:hypothetical protein